MTRIRRAGALLASAGLLLLLAACAAIPTSGGVNQGTVQDLGIPGNVTFAQAGPVPNAQADDIVDGFLLAGTGPQADYRVARKFLTPGFASKWRPATGVLIHNGGVQTSTTSAGTVTVTVPAVARLNANGVYTDYPAPETKSLTFTIETVGGQRRIASAPNGIVLSQSDFTHLFTQRPVQFFDPSWRNLVPDLRWFPLQPDPVDPVRRVMQSLIAGPRGILAAPVAASAFPASTELDRASESGNTADIAITLPSTPSAMQVQRMQQQITESLRNLQVQFSVNGVRKPALDATAGPAPLNALPLVRKGDAFGYLDPMGTVTASPLAKNILAARPTAVTGSASAAAVLAGGRVELVTKAGRTVVDSRARLVAPSLDPQGWVWSVSSDTASDIRVTNAKRVTRVVRSALPSGAMITTIEVSPDGTRLLVLMTAGPSVRASVYGIRRDDSGEPVSLTPSSVSVDVFGTHPIDATWVDTGTVATLGRGTGTDGDAVTVQAVGGVAATLPRLTGTVALAGGRTKSDLVVLLQNGQLLAEPQSVWTAVGAGVQVLAVQR